MKRKLALLLAIVMIVSTGFTAYATEPDNGAQMLKATTQPQTESQTEPEAQRDPSGCLAVRDPGKTGIPKPRRKPPDSRRHRRLTARRGARLLQGRRRLTAQRGARLLPERRRLTAQRGVRLLPERRRLTAQRGARLLPERRRLAAQRGARLLQGRRRLTVQTVHLCPR